MLKRKIKYALIIFAIILSIQMMSYAQEGIITEQRVKFREKPSMDAKTITVLYAKDKIEVIEKEGEWYKVKAEGKTGYVYAEYVKVEQEVPEAEGDTNQETPREEEQQPVGNQEQVDNKNQYPKEVTILETGEMKALPLIQSYPLEKVEKNLTVTALDEINGWVYIATQNCSGWIRIEKLQSKAVVTNSNPEPENSKPNEETNNPEPEEPEDSKKPEQNEKKIKYVNVDSVNVREEQNTNCEVITSLELNTAVTVISEKNNWSKVEIDGKTGYIASRLLSDKKTEVTNRSSDVERKEEEPENKKEETIKEEETKPKEVSNKDLGSEVVAYAKTFLGVRYVSGGSTPKGFDCSGFTKYVYSHFGKSLSRSATAQASNGVAVSKSDLQLGDIIIFRNGSNTAIGHVGIYVGGGNFIHASSPGDVVKITSLSTSYYSARYVTARRIL